MNRQVWFSTFLLSAVIALSGCGIQSIPQSKNEVDAAFAEVTNQYQRRADLVPNLVKVVQAFAKQEKEVFIGVTEARAKATQVTIDPKQLNADTLQRFQKAQGELSQALGRLMVVAEKYPDLKSDQNFRDLQAQLEGTENRITIARQRHIETIKNFNNLVTVPPTSWTNSFLYHHEKMPQWEVQDRGTIEKAPEVKF